MAEVIHRQPTEVTGPLGTIVKAVVTRIDSDPPYLSIPVTNLSHEQVSNLWKEFGRYNPVFVTKGDQREISIKL